jgi:hypothetical protein
MHPSQLRSITSGPDCVCHHARVDHVGINERFGKPSSDQRCQVPECTECQGYVPVGPLNYTVLLCHDFVMNEEDYAETAKVLRGMQLQSFLWLGAALVFMTLCYPAYYYAGAPLAWVCALMAWAAVAMSTVVTVRTISYLEPPRLLMLIPSLLPAAVVVFSTLTPLLQIQPRTYVFGILAVMGVMITSLLIDGHRSKVEFSRAVEEISSDLNMFLIAREQAGAETEHEAEGSS